MTMEAGYCWHPIYNALGDPGKVLHSQDDDACLCAVGELSCLLEGDVTHAHYSQAGGLVFTDPP